jgi:transposase-like protein
MSSVWTPELKEQVKQMYLDAEPTAATSAEIVKDIAEEIEQSSNGVRQVLIQAGVYVKKDAAETSTAKKTTTAKSEGTKRVSKESQLDALKAAILAKGATVDEEIISKLTGKAAAYFVTVLEA